MNLTESLTPVLTSLFLFNTRMTVKQVRVTIKKNSWNSCCIFRRLSERAYYPFKEHKGISAMLHNSNISQQKMFHKNILYNIARHA